MAAALVIGVGNPYRRDDGVGVAVVDALLALACDPEPDPTGSGQLAPPAEVEIVEESGESAALVARWSGHRFVILVDAISSGAAAGSVQRIECSAGRWDLGSRVAATSTHGLGLADAVALGQALGRLPERLVIFGVEADDTSNGAGLSPAVSTAVDAVISAVLVELNSELGQLEVTG